MPGTPSEDFLSPNPDCGASTDRKGSEGAREKKRDKGLEDVGMWDRGGVGWGRKSHLHPLSTAFMSILWSTILSMINYITTLVSVATADAPCQPRSQAPSHDSLPPRLPPIPLHSFISCHSDPTAMYPALYLRISPRCAGPDRPVRQLH